MVHPVLTMSDDPPPTLSIAAETPVYELEKAQAARQLSWMTREMAANLLRVMRGAGRPALLPQQIIDLGEAILETNENARAWAIWSAIEDTLHSAVSGDVELSEAEECECIVVQGSLQLAASRLLSQRAQEAAGSREITTGIRRLEQERLRRKWAEELASQALKRTARTVTKKKPRKTQKKQASAKPTTLNAVATDDPSKPKSTAEFMKSRRRELSDTEE